MSEILCFVNLTDIFFFCYSLGLLLNISVYETLKYLYVYIK